MAKLRTIIKITMDTEVDKEKIIKLIYKLIKKYDDESRIAVTNKTGTNYLGLGGDKTGEEKR